MNNKYKIDLSYNEVFVDFDDCILIKEEINTNLIAFIFQCINRNIKILHTKGLNRKSVDIPVGIQIKQNKPCITKINLI